MGIIWNNLPTFYLEFFVDHFDHFGEIQPFFEAMRFVIPTDVANPFEDSNGK